MGAYELIPPPRWRTIWARGNENIAVAVMFCPKHWGVGVEIWPGLVDLYVGPVAFVIGSVRVIKRDNGNNN